MDGQGHLRISRISHFCSRGSSGFKSDEREDAEAPDKLTR